MPLTDMPFSSSPPQRGGFVEEAAMLQQAGRNGDNMLVHMNPEEVGALNQMGGAGLGGLQQAQMTINPQTGLPEMFNFKDALPTIIGIGATMMGMPSIGAGLAAGGTSMVTTKGDLGRSLMAGLGAWGGAELANVWGGAGEATALGGLNPDLAQAGAASAGSAGAPGMAFGATGSSVAATPYQVATEAIGPAAGEAAWGDMAQTVGQEQFNAMAAAAKTPAGLVTDVSQAAYRADPSLGAITKGMGATDFGSWTSTGGKLGWDKLAQPGAAAVLGTAGSMPPPPIPEREEEEDRPAPPPPDYGYTGSPPEGYRPGIDPEYDYFQFANQGGYVNDLPTVYARSGMMDKLTDNRLARGLGSAGERMYDTFLPFLNNPFRQEDVVAALPEEEEVSPEGDAEAAQANFQGMTPEQQARTLMGGMGRGMGMNFQMEGGTRGDVVLPTINAKFGWKDAAGILSPAYMLHKADLGPIAGGIIPSFLHDKFRSDDDDDQVVDPEDEANAMMASPSTRVSGGRMYMEHGTQGETVWEPPDEGMTGDTTTPLESLSTSQIIKALQAEGLPPDQIGKYMDPSADFTESPPPSLPMILKEGGGVVGQLQNLGGQAEDFSGSLQRLGDQGKSFASNVQSTLGGTGGGMVRDFGQPLTSLDPYRASMESGPIMNTRGQPQLLGSDVAIPRGGNPFSSSLSNQFSLGRQQPSYQRDLLKQVSFAEGSEGMVVNDATSGVMSVASPGAQNALAERLAVAPASDEPQNAEERAIYDSALLALQGMLEGDAAEMAIEEFIETFGPEAYRMLEELVSNQSDDGGIVQPANGETTVADGEIQGPDVIPGKIVDPVTGEQTANLRVGENEYIEPADSLQRRAMAAGLPPSPQNGARVRGEEEKQLEAMYG